MRPAARIGFVILLAMILPPPSARAIQLRWASGQSDVSITSATRCTLVVQADDIETSLPRDWRLLWVADTSAVIPVAIQGSDSCGLGLARPATLTAPTNALDMLSNRPIVSFCSLGSGLVYIAQQIVDLPGGSRGKFKVVAIDRTDPTASRVIESPEVTFNGGIADAFPPAILRLETVHQSTEYQIHVIGAGLGAVQQATLVAPDESWEVPLTMTSISDDSLTATADLAAWIPDCWVELSDSSGKYVAERVPADPPPPPLNPDAACQARFIEDIYPPAVIQPKDFAFVAGGWSPQGSWTFHLFYIRSNQLSKSRCPTDNSCLEKNIGHAVSNDLASWTVLDTAAIRVRAGKFDSQHVWAPTIIRKGVKYFMFYTGVDDNGIQSIGRATSTDLINWSQEDQVLTRTNAGAWVDQAGTDLRDPYIMEDPSVPGQYLLYFTAKTNVFNGMAVGFVKSSDVTFSTFQPGGVLWRSQQNRASSLESPTVFQRSGRWWVFFTKPISTQDTIYAFSSATSPSDTLTGSWSPISSIRDLVPLSEATAYTFWHGTEDLKIAGPGGGKEYFAGFNDSDQSISYTQMRDVPPPLVFGGDCPDALTVGPPRSSASFGLRVVTPVSPDGGVTLEITLPSATHAGLAILDVLGRRIATVFDGNLPGGVSVLKWDGRTSATGRAASGMYFARLQTVHGQRSAHAAFVR